MIYNRKQMRKFQIKMLFFARDPYKRAELLKKEQVFYKMGKSCFYQPHSLPTEPFLISMGDNVYVCANVRLVTHDVVGNMLKTDSKYKEQVKTCNTDFYMGKIQIGNNVVIGADAVVLYGVTVGDNVIIGAGSVVTHDVPSGAVVAGNPARVVGEYDALAQKRILKMTDMPKKTDGPDKLVEYFWNK